MTTVQCSFYDSDGVALVGFVNVKLDYTLMDSAETKTYLPVLAKVPLVSGECSLNLAPSEVDGITYLIEVYQTTTISVEDPDNPGSFIDADVDTKADEYRVIVPDSVTPLQLESLSRKTGIDRDRTATMIPVVLRRMYADNNFWSQVQANLFPHKGNWSAATTYRRGDVVVYDGSTWLYYAQEASSGVIPVDGATWRVLALRGANGTGTTGNDTPFSVAWDGATDAPSRNAVYDALQGYATAATVSGLAPLNSPALTGTPTRTVAPASNANNTELATTAWVQTLITALNKAMTPVGMMASFAGGSAPTGWVLCDGRTLSRSTYAALFAVIGTTYNTGGEAGTDFRIPDMRGRSVLAPDDMGGSAASRSPGVTYGTSGGTSTVTLTAAQMPVHKHNISMKGFSATGLVDAGGVGFAGVSFGSVAPTVGLTNQAGNRAAAGDGLGAILDAGGTSGITQAHNNLHPYLSVNVIMYTGV